MAAPMAILCFFSSLSPKNSTPTRVVSRMMLTHTSGKAYVIATHNKIGVTSNYRLGKLDEIHGIITDREGAEFFRTDSDIKAEIIEA